MFPQLVGQFKPTLRAKRQALQKSGHNPNQVAFLTERYKLTPPVLNQP